jgi:protease PrsW
MFFPDLLPGAIVGSAVAPALLLLWLIVAADSRPEPPRAVWIAFGLSAVITIPVGLVEVWLQAHIPITDNPTLAPFQKAFVWAGLPEEIAKVSIIAAVALRARYFDEPMDGVVYGTAVGLGFATVENVLYVVSAKTGWESVAIMRAVLSVPFHGALGAIAGAYIARARFSGTLGGHRTEHWHRFRMFAAAWLIPIVMHTVFDGAMFTLSSAGPKASETGEGGGWVALMLVVAFADAIGGIVFAILLARRIAPATGGGQHQTSAARSLARDLGAVDPGPRLELRRRCAPHRRKFGRAHRGRSIADRRRRAVAALRQISQRCRQTGASWLRRGITDAWPSG